MTELETLRALVDAACASLERSRRRIDDLNVYPVPDGDTGTNLLLTARGVADALAHSEAGDRQALAQEVTRAALLSARGNSGVILSQIVRGAAEALADADAIDSRAVAHAFRAASDAAYAAVREPVEGTILTVARELADEADAQQDAAIAELFAAVVRRGDEAVARTTEQLDVLRQAGVVDAGAAGLLELVRGIAASLAGEELPPPPSAEELAPEAVHQAQSRFRYCTTFVVEGEGLDADALERELERLGDSLMVVGDPSALKAHVHTDDPDAALALGAAVGTVERVEVADMRAQTEEREARLTSVEPAARCGVVAVSAGAGNRRLFESLGAARIVQGGQTMNPPTAELLAALEATNADEAVLLPNNANVILAAEQAAQLAERPVEVVPTRSLQAGLAALIAFNPERSAAENASEMFGAAETIVAGEVATASRDATIAGVAVRRDEFLGLAGGRVVAAGPVFGEVGRAVAEALLAEPRDVLTLVTGEGAPSLDGLLDELAERHPELEIEVHEGGQPHYPLLLSAE
ncbi:MAG: DAK2 domain-containing protein [Actinobacteria bacterium]|nr:MAG: DAK2 domain-containing protein [Actinomycetota bacterium]